MYLFFDTKIIGFQTDTKKTAEESIDSQPRLLQLAYICYDENRRLFKEGNFYVLPEDFDFNKPVPNICGIDNRFLIFWGDPVKKALENFVYKAMKKTQRVVSHNLFFNENVVKAELFRCGMQDCFKDKWKTCTMVSSTSYCKIKRLFGSYRHPSLQELYYTLFGAYYEDEHNALNNVYATAKCFWELVDRGIIPDSNKYLKPKSNKVLYKEPRQEVCYEDESTLPEDMRYCFRCEGELTRENWEEHMCPHCGRYLYPWEDEQ